MDGSTKASKTEHESADESKASDSSTTIGNDKDTQSAAAQSNTQSSNKSKVKSKSKKLTGTNAVDESSVITSPSSSCCSGSNGGTCSGTGQLNATQLEAVLKNNPALKSELGDLDAEKLREKMKGMGIEDLLTGTAIGGKNQKNMASYKFWQTQPVPSFQDSAPVQEGPIKTIDPAQVPKEPSPFVVEGFEWVTMDLEDSKELEELYDLLSHHYVEDDDAMFRFNYSSSFLNWALKAPGWRKEWHVGVRATKSRRLVAFISGIPVGLRVRKTTVNCSEVNFLCIHKKLRSKRLAPILIQEITRRCYVESIFQAIYTAGIVLPKPVSTCRYFHRSLNWSKLYDVEFAPLPLGSTKAIQISKNKLPASTSTQGLRQMEQRDINAVSDLLNRYLERFDLTQTFTKDEIEHWLLHKGRPSSERVIWTYVVEDPKTCRLTDFFSFYALNSTVIDNSKHEQVRAAYLFYYATETAFTQCASVLQTKLRTLMNDALIIARDEKFDVFNALTLLNNPMFLEHLKFKAGDGQLHYYLYNYRAAPIAGGVDSKNKVDEKYMGGVGMVML